MTPRASVRLASRMATLFIFVIAVLAAVMVVQLLVRAMLASRRWRPRLARPDTACGDVAEDSDGHDDTGCGEVGRVGAIVLQAGQLRETTTVSEATSKGQCPLAI